MSYLILSRWWLRRKGFSMFWSPILEQMVATWGQFLICSLLWEEKKVFTLGGVPEYILQSSNEWWPHGDTQ